MSTTSKPSSALLYEDGSDYVIEAGENVSPANIAGAHRWLGADAAHHDGHKNVSPRSNRVQDGQLPQVSGPPVGPPNAINPAGNGFSSSLTD